MKKTARELAVLEPWRTGLGQPNALQIDWLCEPIPCKGEVIFDPVISGTRTWWRCTLCGYCGCLSNTHHNRPLYPEEFYSDALDLFYTRRKEQGIEHNLTVRHAGYIMGTALRATASLPPEMLGEVVRGLVELYR